MLNISLKTTLTGVSALSGPEEHYSLTDANIFLRALIVTKLCQNWNIQIVNDGKCPYSYYAQRFFSIHKPRRQIRALEELATGFIILRTSITYPTHTDYPVMPPVW